MGAAVCGELPSSFGQDLPESRSFILKSFEAKDDGDIHFSSFDTLLIALLPVLHCGNSPLILGFQALLQIS